MPTVLITGAGAGVGRATATALVNHGHRVHAGVRDISRDSDNNDSDIDVANISFIELDVNSDISVRRAVDRVIAIDGRVDVLINNAAILVTGSVEMTPLSVFQEVMNTNYFGALRCIKEVLPYMREQNGGLIINVSSLGGRVASPIFSPYSPSKFALAALSESLAQEVAAFGIRIVVADLGLVKTKMSTTAQRDYCGVAYSRFKRRLTALRDAMLATPGEALDAEVAAELIRGVVDRTGLDLHCLIGEDVSRYLSWRNEMSDNDWIAFWALADDSEWCQVLRQDRGLDVEPFLKW